MLALVSLYLCACVLLGFLVCARLELGGYMCLIAF